MVFSKEAHNIKPRSVRCIACKRMRITDEPNPKCTNCGWSMVTVISFNHFTLPEKSNDPSGT